MGPVGGLGVLSTQPMARMTASVWSGLAQPLWEPAPRVMCVCSGVYGPLFAPPPPPVSCAGTAPLSRGTFPALVSHRNGVVMVAVAAGRLLRSAGFHVR